MPVSHLPAEASRKEVLEVKLRGKNAVVTGATRGMGRAIAELFAREGAAVVLGGRDGARGKRVQEAIRSAGGRAELALGDLADPDASRRLVETAREAFGGVDVLIANAGLLGLGSVTELPFDTWRKTLAVNLDAVFHLMRFGVPELRARGGGSIVVNASIAALKGFPNHAAYCASKAGAVALARQAAIDLAPKIRVNALLPGPVDTPLIWESAAAFPDPDKAVSDVAAKTLAKRLGEPVDIARAALFLASDDSSWITGAALTVDGGIMAGG